MKVFLTGATGYIGTAVGRALIAFGHEVRGLVRSEAARDELLARGWTPVAGGLGDADVLRREAEGADAAIHAANTGDEEAAEIDTAATRALLAALEGSGKPFVYTSGVWVLGATGDAVADESADTDPAAPLSGWRAALEGEVLGAAQHGVGAVVLRPGVVYGEGGGLLGMLARGELPVVDGGQRWSLIHRQDLAELYVKALAAPPGSILHAVSEVATLDDLVAALAEADPDLSPRRLSVEEAREEMGAFAEALALDQRVDASRTQELLDWRPQRVGAEEDLSSGPTVTA